MRLAVISDIHGNLAALEAVVECDLEVGRRELADAGFPLADWLASVRREARYSRPL